MRYRNGVKGAASACRTSTQSARAPHSVPRRDELNAPETSWTSIFAPSMLAASLFLSACSPSESGGDATAWEEASLRREEEATGKWEGREVERGRDWKLRRAGRRRLESRDCMISWREVWKWPTTAERKARRAISDSCSSTLISTSLQQLQATGASYKVTLGWLP